MINPACVSAIDRVVHFPFCRSVTSAMIPSHLSFTSGRMVANSCTDHCPPPVMHWKLRAPCFSEMACPLKILHLTCRHNLNTPAIPQRCTPPKIWHALTSTICPTSLHFLKHPDSSDANQHDKINVTQYSTWISLLITSYFFLVLRAITAYQHVSTGSSAHLSTFSQCPTRSKNTIHKHNWGNLIR